MANKSNNSTTASKEAKTVSIKEVRNTIQDIKKKLDEQIESYNRKAKLIQDRDMFISTQNEILAYIKDQGVDFDPSLNSRRMVLRLSDNRSYNSDNIVSISNNAVIRDILGILLSKINQKIEEIEKQILD